MNKENRYTELIDRWFSERESGEDIAALFEQLEAENELPELIAALKEKYDQLPAELYPADKTAALVHSILKAHPLENELPISNGKQTYKWRWLAAAATLVISIGIYYWAATPTEPVVAVLAADIAPGRNGAILTLANGSNVVLDSLGNGVVANQNGVTVKLNQDQLAYESTGAIAGKLTYNVMSTPKGRQFQVKLPDGTMVWLNSASSLRYPTAFIGSERKVELTGEAYFEVTKNEKMPFQVSVNHQAEIEVLGTHFNVNAYDNEKTLTTTLLEGKVHIYQTSGSMSSSGSRKADRSGGVILKPGQQALVTNGQQEQSEIAVINAADIDKAMAWKNGLFNFEGATLEDVLKQVERWYDITIKYESTIPVREFQGKLPRGLNLSQVLKILAEMDVKVRLEGRVLFVE